MRPSGAPPMPFSCSTRPTITLPDGSGSTWPAPEASQQGRPTPSIGCITLDEAVPSLRFRQGASTDVFDGSTDSGVTMMAAVAADRWSHGYPGGAGRHRDRGRLPQRPRVREHHRRDHDHRRARPSRRRCSRAGHRVRAASVQRNWAWLIARLWASVCIIAGVVGVGVSLLSDTLTAARSSALSSAPRARPSSQPGFSGTSTG